MLPFKCSAVVWCLFACQHVCLKSHNVPPADKRETAVPLDGGADTYQSVQEMERNGTEQRNETGQDKQLEWMSMVFAVSRRRRLTADNKSAG